MTATTRSAPDNNNLASLPAGPAAETAANGNDPRANPTGRAKPPVSQASRKAALKRAVFVLLILCASVGAAKLIHHWWTIGRFIESTDDAYVGGDITVIAPKISGFIAQLAVGDNQRVQAGDLLLKLDARDALAALAKAEASVAVQQAALTNLEATRHLQAAIISQARAETASADAEVKRAHDDQIRYQTLLANGAESVQSSQKADALYQQALAAGDKSRALLSAAQRQLEVIQAQKQQSQAAWEQAIAERELARLNLSYTELRAPIDGVVGNRSAQVGAYATTGAQLIALVPTHGLWIDANFKESQIHRMRPGSPVTVRIDSIPGQTFSGQVVSIAPATGAQFSVLPPENATGNFTRIVQRLAVRIALDNEPATLGQLRPGLSVIAKVDTRPITKASP